jgi:hypothetical protein
VSQERFCFRSKQRVKVFTWWRGVQSQFRCPRLRNSFPRRPAPVLCWVSVKLYVATPTNSTPLLAKIASSASWHARTFWSSCGRIRHVVCRLCACSATISTPSIIASKRDHASSTVGERRLAEFPRFPRYSTKEKGTSIMLVPRNQRELNYGSLKLTIICV